MEFTETIPLAARASDVDLAEWVFNLSDAEYRACAEGHHAMGIIGGDKRLGIINVEQIGGTLIVQHYYTRIAERSRTHFVSDASEGFLLRAVPFTMKVWWDMKVEPDSEQAKFTCTIGYDAPGWVDAAGTLVRNQHSVHEHLKEETGNFARDIERKFGRPAGAAMPGA